MPTSGPSEHGHAISDIVKDIQGDIKALVQGEIALAKTELIPSAKNAGVGGGLLAGAGYFGAAALGLLFIAGSLAIWQWLQVPIAVGFVIMAGVLLVVAALLGLVGYTALRRVKAPERTIAQTKSSIEAVRGAISQGTAAAKAPMIEGQVVGQRSLGSAGRTPTSR